MAGDADRARTLWATLITILGGFLGGGCLSGGFAALWAVRTLTISEPGCTRIRAAEAAWLMVLMYGFCLVPVSFVLGGFAGSVLCALIRRSTGRIPVLSYAGFVLTLVSAVWLYWPRPTSAVTPAAAAHSAAAPKSQSLPPPEPSADQLHQERQGRFVEAARNGNVAEVDRLLKQGANVNGVTNGHCSLCDAVLSDRREVVRLLLDRGASIDREEPVALMNPLMCGAYSGNRDMVRHLLDRGADPNVNTWDGAGTGGTALKVAKDPQIKEMLISASRVEPPVYATGDEIVPYPG